MVFTLINIYTYYLHINFCNQETLAPHNFVVQARIVCKAISQFGLVGKWARSQPFNVDLSPQQIELGHDINEVTMQQMLGQGEASKQSSVTVKKQPK